MLKIYIFVSGSRHKKKKCFPLLNYPSIFCFMSSVWAAINSTLNSLTSETYLLHRTAHPTAKMTFDLETETTIAAAPEKVWSILMDLEAYSHWNPFVTSILHDESHLTVGSHLKVSISPPDGKPMLFKPQVTELKKHRVFEWEGSFVFPILFKGRHRFELVPTADGGTRFVHTEKFSGWLLPLIKSDLDKNARKGFENMNKALKAQAEKST